MAHIFLLPGAQMALEIFGIFWPLDIKIISIDHSKTELTLRLKEKERCLFALFRPTQKSGK